MIDWDRHLQGPLQRAFGGPVTYRPAGAAPFPLTAIFDAAAVVVVVDVAGGVDVSSTAPVLTVRLADFPAGGGPRVEDEVDADGRRWRVDDVRPDGAGGADLILHRIDLAANAVRDGAPT